MTYPRIVRGLPADPIPDGLWSPPALTPAGWICVQRGTDGAAYRHSTLNMSVILSAAVYSDNRPWVHFSIARSSRLPSWEEYTAAKDAFLGPETKAIQVLAPRSQWVNIHPFCLHAFACLDDDGLPDFTQGSGQL